MWDTIAFFAGTLDMCFVRVFPDWFTHLGRQPADADGPRDVPLPAQGVGQGRAPSEQSPLWAEESLATWAGHQVAPATYAPADKAPGSFYRYWNEHWAKKLFTRTYDGLGFIGRVEQVSGASGVWDRVKSVWTAKEDSPGRLRRLTGSNQPDVLNTWGSGLYRQPSFPAGWHQTVPWDVPGHLRAGVLQDDDPARRGDGAAGDEGLPRRTCTSCAATSGRWCNVTVEGFGRVTDGKTDWPQPDRAVVLLRRQVRVPARASTRRRPSRPHADIGDKLYAGLAARPTASRRWCSSRTRCPSTARTTRSRSSRPPERGGGAPAAAAPTATRT